MTPPQQSSLQRQATEVAAPAPVETPEEAVRRTIQRYRPVLQQALPRHLTLDQFLATIYQAVKSTPKLIECDPETIVGAALKAASLGLAPADGRGHCALIPRWNRNLYGKDRGGQEATYQTMYKGGIELARRSGVVHRFVARTVYAGDDFVYEYGLHERLEHRPCPPQDRGEPTWWYAIAWDREGTMLDFSVLTRAEVEYHRSFSSQADSPMWTRSYDAAARKTAVWEVLKLLPQSPDLADAMASDDRVIRLGAGGRPEVIPEPIQPRVETAALSAPEAYGDADAPEVSPGPVEAPSAAEGPQDEAPATELPPVPERERPQGGAKARAVVERHAPVDTTGEVTDAPPVP